MAQTKKYGAFTGVFTPSILTILGVIMYLRLPWIVGQAGLYMVFGIVLVAHIVSICTGLSVSSIATDKKVEGGGSYYIISRSLGLPIGGTLGIALFFGLSFSVSLYVIGFSESFNGYWGLGGSVNAIRVTGTVVLLLVTILTFISTSLALKAQFFILAAIILSLLSVLFGHSPYVPQQLSLSPQATAPSMMVLFGIFFPAVTGFEAGVSMSGDLEDPKRAIPVGTIAAILVGLTVYMLLPVFLLSRVDAVTLVSNPNVLLEIALVPALVIAGIWAATVSSAIGSILGAPRILQATAVDGITPKFFARGHGKANEPRNAILVTFLIAEAGILIGELDIIARVVSTFFITTYGFLNLTCAVERWASSDFRPSFKVPQGVSLLGFLTCVIVMIQLDLLAMIGGCLILGGLLFFLKRRELTLKSGDAWESVWLSVVRMGLFKLSQGGRHQRNWKPNILLFSGGSVARPYLIAFGKWISGQLGMVSNFDLIENPSAKVLFPHSIQAAVTDPETFEGVFTRRQECRDVYEGIDTIARTYGFSGIEPNAVLMGWRRKAKHPEAFAQLMVNLRELDYSLMVMNYHEEKGFGACKTIDVWWRGGGNNGNLTLALLTFILASPQWRDARVRFLVDTRESALIETIYKNMTRSLQDARIEGEIKVINNAAGERSFKEILAAESSNADLTILGLPELTLQNAGAAIEKTNDLLSGLGTTLLVGASSFFNPVVTGIEYDAKREAPVFSRDALANLGPQSFGLPPLTLPSDGRLRLHVTRLDRFSLHQVFQTVERHLLTVHERNRSLVHTLGELVDSALDRIEGLAKEGGSPRARRALGKVQGDLFFQVSRQLSEFKETSLPNQNEMLGEAVRSLHLNLEGYLQSVPERLTALHDSEAMSVLPGDRMGLRVLKWRTRMGCRLRSDGTPDVSVPFRHLVGAVWDHHLWTAWLSRFHQVGIQQYSWVKEIQGLVKLVKDRLEWAESRFGEAVLLPEEMEASKGEIAQAVERIQQANDTVFYELTRGMVLDLRHLANQVAMDAASVDAAYRTRQHAKQRKEGKTVTLRMAEFPGAWLTNQTLFVDMLSMDLSLMAYQRRLTVILKRIKQDWFLILENGLHDKIERLLQEVDSWLNQTEEQGEKEASFSFEVKSSLISEQAVKGVVTEIQPALEQIPEVAQAIGEPSLQQLQEGRFVEVESLAVDLRELLKYIVYADLLNPLRQHLAGIPATVDHIVSNVKDAVRFFSFHLAVSDTPEEALVGEEREAMINQAVTRIEKEMAAVSTLQQALMDAIDEGVARVAEKTNPWRIIHSSDDLRRYIRFQDNKKVLSFFEKKRRGIELWGQELLIKKIYQRTPGVLTALGKAAGGQEESMVKRVLERVDRVSPGNGVLSALPFHYRQLFLGDQPPSKEFWVGRDAEMARAQTTVDRFRSGTSGALMVTGEWLSGKSALAHHVAHSYFDRQSVFQVFPPPEGSCGLDTFHKALEEALQVRGRIERLFLQLPPHSVMVIHNLELWWERHPNGDTVTHHIEWLIRTFGHHCFFILTMNTHALTLLRNLQPLDDYFLDVVTCGPMTAAELKTLILMRHKATGLKFTLGNHSEETLSELMLARLFRRFYDWSGGNVGVALHAWVSHIDEVKGNTVRMGYPVLPDPTQRFQLPIEWMVVILQFVLHKVLSRERLMRLMVWPEEECLRFVDVLQRAGILQERGEGLWSLTPWLVPDLIDELRRGQML
ncbi:hypothetical protein DSLASN_09190 [Desulfoluna limicola]|uniref:Amino acid permease/ SLC12A domain-containing protein n=1 Tax=Desulfoluna limicola TaxID=2810562 RepID=A0ABM7PCA7_9BACT|nr:hypothetical protein [Desulfoluna limicola]BCS95287.1 hypothetical protein DSLASN_09190 [Desulfoluna limicola]